MRDRHSKKNHQSAVVACCSWLAMLLIGLLCSCTAQGAELTGGRDVQQFVCRISNQVQGANNLGSGTLIDRTENGREGLVLTCAHLFREGTGEVIVRFASGKSHRARVLQVDHEADLAALLIGNPANEPATVALKMSAQSRLQACGYGPRGVYRCAVGRQVGQAASPGQVSLLINDAVRSGDSGGGVFDEQGRLVAVIWGESQGITYASYGQPLQRFLSRVLGRRMSAVYRCPGGVCPSPRQQPVVIQPRNPIRQPQQQPLLQQPTLNSPQWTDFQRQLDELRNQKQDRGDYLTREELSEAGRGVGFEFQGAGEKKESESQSRPLESPIHFPNGGSLGRVAGTAAVGLLGLSGPAGWGVIAAASVGGWLIGRRVKRKLNGAGGRRRRRFRDRD